MHSSQIRKVGSLIFRNDNHLTKINTLQIIHAFMECAVYDTYVTKKDGRTMHFDVIVEAKTPYEKAIEYGKRYLESVNQGGQKMTQEECQFCHIQEAPKQVEREISSKGFFIQKMEGCS
jgi:hypothetical protein